MPELEPITREERLLDGEDLTPITRKEKILAGEDIETITREEYFLKKYRGSGGDVDLQTLNVTENGTVNAPSGVAYNKVVTDVPQPTLTTLNVTENGTVIAPSGTAYNEVDVDVPLPENAYLLEELSNLPQPIATFNDGSDNPLKSLTASIVPVQSGSGDPSPTNVRLISGWTEEVVTRTGKNIWDKSEYQNLYTDYDFTYDVYHIKKIQLKPNVTVTVSQNAGSTSTTLIIINNKTNINSAGYLDLRKASDEKTFVTDENGCLYIGCYAGNTDYNNRINECNLQIEFGSTATTYEPYAGTTTTIPFTDGQGNPVEVFGGSVDVVNGVLTIPNSRTVKTFNGSENWIFFSSGCFYIENVFENVASDFQTSKSNPKCLCNFLNENNINASSASVPNMDDNSFANQAGYYINRLWVKMLSITTLEDFKTYLGNHNLQIDYPSPLATPITYQLTPTSIKSLDGENNLSASTGDVEELKYFSKEAE